MKYCALYGFCLLSCVLNTAISVCSIGDNARDENVVQVKKAETKTVEETNNIFLSSTAMAQKTAAQTQEYTLRALKTKDDLTVASAKGITSVEAYAAVITSEYQEIDNKANLAMINSKKSVKDEDKPNSVAKVSQGDSGPPSVVPHRILFMSDVALCENEVVTLKNNENERKLMDIANDSKNKNNTTSDRTEVDLKNTKTSIATLKTNAMNVVSGEISQSEETKKSPSTNRIKSTKSTTNVGAYLKDSDAMMQDTIVENSESAIVSRIVKLICVTIGILIAKVAAYTIWNTISLHNLFKREKDNIEGVEIAEKVAALKNNDADKALQDAIDGVQNAEIALYKAKTSVELARTKALLNSTRGYYYDAAKIKVITDEDVKDIQIIFSSSPEEVSGQIERELNMALHAQEEVNTEVKKTEIARRNVQQSITIAENALCTLREAMRLSIATIKLNVVEAASAGAKVEVISARKALNAAKAAAEKVTKAKHKVTAIVASAKVTESLNNIKNYLNEARLKERNSTDATKIVHKVNELSIHDGAMTLQAKLSMEKNTMMSTEMGLRRFVSSYNEVKSEMPIVDSTFNA